MKTTKAMLIYFISFVLGYMLISVIGVMFIKPDSSHYSYAEILGSSSWFTTYSFFIGWWVSAFVAMEYLEQQKRRN